MGREGEPPPPPANSRTLIQVCSGAPAASRGSKGGERLEGEEPSIAVMKFLMASPCLHLYELRAKDWSPSLLPPSYGIIWCLRRGPYLILAWVAGVELGRSEAH